MKELGMFSQYLKATGTHAVPAMEWAVKNWSDFRYLSQEQLGEAVPSTPRIGALLKCCTVAVEGYLKAQTPVSYPTPVQTSAQVEVDEVPMATKEEIEAMLKSMDKDED
jgi:hypothetical protein